MWLNTYYSDFSRMKYLKNIRNIARTLCAINCLKKRLYFDNN